MSEQLPVLFIGHGSPLNAIEDNQFSQGWRKLAKNIPKPEKILCISAHWYISETAVTIMSKPKTIHDFYGFPEELYTVQYNAPGDQTLAKQITQLIKTVPVRNNQEWGLDHGTWSVLRQMYPAADIPVVQLSIDHHLSADEHYQIGQELVNLRSAGVLIIGSGNIVHNLMRINWAANTPYPWAKEFEQFVKDSLNKKDHLALINSAQRPEFTLAHPTPEHFLPFLYCLGAAGGAIPKFYNDEFFAASLSMACMLWAGN